MDVFLSLAAQKALASAAVLAGRTKPAGVLLGHVRGGRYFVEDAAAGAGGDWAAPETFARLDEIHPGRIVGFFAFSRAAAVRRRIGRPHACGRVFLSLAIGRGGELEARGSFIDYEGRFVFQPLDVFREREARP